MFRVFPAFPPTRFFRALIAILCGLIPLLASHVQAYEPVETIRILNPKVYSSPSRDYTLTVTPGDRYGRGGATYCLRYKGALVWEGTRPFTLWEAGVTDNGTVGGYAYPQGWVGRDHEGFTVVILDPTGETRLQEKIRHEDRASLHTPAHPLVAGLIVDGAQDFLIVRGTEYGTFEDANHGVAVWWVYRLSTGQAIKWFAPRQSMEPNNEKLRLSILDAQPVAGRPLVLIHWLRFDDTPAGVGTRFTLPLSPAAKPFWSLELPHDYFLTNAGAEDRLLKEIRTQGAILSAGPAGRFTLRFAAQKQRVTFAVAPATGGKWRVVETGRAPYISPDPEVRFHAPSVHLAPTGHVVLKDQGPLTPVRCIYEPIAAGPGRIAFLRRDATTDLVLMNDWGTVLHTLPLNPILSVSDDCALTLLWRGGTRFLVSVEHHAGRTDSVTEACAVDLRTASITRLPKWLGATRNTPPAPFTPRYPNGTPMDSPTLFAAQDGHFWASDTYSLLRLDAHGKADRRLGEAPPIDQLRAVGELVIRPDGSILAADERTCIIHLFDSTGKRLWLCDPRQPKAGKQLSLSALEAPSPYSAFSPPRIELGSNNTFFARSKWFDGNGHPCEKPSGFRSVSERFRHIQRRADGTWLEMGNTWAVAPNGKMAIVDDTGYQTSITSQEHIFLSLYSAQDAPEHTIELPSRLTEGTVQLAYNGSRVILAHNGRIYAYSATGEPRWQFAMPQARAAELLWQPFLTDNGRTLCLFDGERTIYRYVLPPDAREAVVQNDARLSAYGTSRVRTQSQPLP